MYFIYVLVILDDVSMSFIVNFISYYLSLKHFRMLEISSVTLKKSCFKCLIHQSITSYDQLDLWPFHTVSSAADTLEVGEVVWEWLIDCLSIDGCWQRWRNSISWLPAGNPGGSGSWTSTPDCWTGSGWKRVVMSFYQDFIDSERSSATFTGFDNDITAQR